MIDDKIVANWYLNDELLGKFEFEDTDVDEIYLGVCFYKEGQEMAENECLSP